jgi:hypothetical protein
MIAYSDDPVAVLGHEAHPKQRVLHPLIPGVAEERLDMG